MTPELDLDVDVMVTSGVANLVGVTGPKYGSRDTAQEDAIESTFIDPKTGLTVYVRFFSLCDWHFITY